MPDDLRTRIAKVIWEVFQNTPAIDAADDEWESWWNDSTQEEKALCYAQADAVIRELDTEFLDFGLWLSEELRGWPMTRTDLESCIKDWKGKNPDGNV